ncbi:LAMI_0H18910g1_1 [Lachancea mirantina]|uniref:Octanoyltransferase n=1 Tax=Lachancea mirantina TaxID=1230905 RepID=A0A1G4KJX2_9SACH|nr:LAMI_0H18910g1_1 [Lachancea mirantina]
MKVGLFCNPKRTDDVSRTTRRLFNLRYASCCTKSGPLTHPIDPSAKSLRHLNFTGQIPFQKGLKLQEKFVRAQLDMKELSSKIDKKLKQLEIDNPGAVVNEHEETILKSILDMKPGPVLLTFEFEPTYTGGKRMKRQLRPEKIAAFERFRPAAQTNDKAPRFVQVERGGQVTFHGPGQMVAYIIMDLKCFHSFPARCLVSALEKSAINSLEKLTHQETEQPLRLEPPGSGETGVWVDKQSKIASIGVHVRRSVSSHGICINVSPELSYMNNFVMCGLPETTATSILEQNPASQISVSHMANAFAKEFASIIGVELVEHINVKSSEIQE